MRKVCLKTLSPVEAVGDMPNQLLARVKADMVRMKKVIDTAGISAK